MPRSKKNNLSIIPEDIEGERNDSNLVLNKGKLERSKKTHRKSNRSKDKSESVVASRNKSRSKSKAKKERRNKTKANTTQMRLQDEDEDEIEDRHRQSLFQKNLEEEHLEKERLRLEEEKLTPEEVMPEQVLQRMLASNIHGTDIHNIQGQIDKLKDFKTKDHSQFDRNKYDIGKIFTNADIPGHNVIPDFQYLNDDQYTKKMDFYSAKFPSPNDIELANKFMEKNFEALSDMHRRGYEHLIKLKKQKGEFSVGVSEQMWRNPLIPPHIWDPDKQFSKRGLTAEERADQHNRTIRLKKEILNEYVHPFHIDSPYYYGTKDIRPPYKDIDAKNYENSKKEWDETLEALYGDDPVPELIPLTLEEMGVKPELAKPITEEQKEEYKNYYSDKFDENVLAHQIRWGVGEGALEGIWHGLPELLEIIKDYYDGPTIKGCLEIRKQGLDQISKGLNTYGSFADKHLSYCSDNTLLTEVYLRNFEKLPNEFILPDHHHFNAVLSECSPSYSGRYLPPILRTQLINILENLGLYKYPPDFSNIPGSINTVSITPTSSAYLLAQTFKRLKRNETQIFNTRDMLMINSGSGKRWPGHIQMVMESGETVYEKSKHKISIQPGNGIDLLRLVLELLEEAYNLIKTGKAKVIGSDGKKVPDSQSGANVIKQEMFDIERTKRYIILIFMGLIGPNTVDRIMSLDTFFHDRGATVYTSIVKHEKGVPDISTYDEKLGKNTGPRVRKPLSAVDLALYKNELVELDWKLDLLSDMKDLHNYFMQKLKKPYEIVNYGDDYPDYFKNYYNYNY
tara:strand:- start:2404 stop:4785 length:2382 start_codon:yes stop_codon:yes gene_type:complete